MGEQLNGPSGCCTETGRTNTDAVGIQQYATQSITAISIVAARIPKISAAFSGLFDGSSGIIGGVGDGARSSVTLTTGEMNSTMYLCPMLSTAAVA